MSYFSQSIAPLQYGKKHSIYVLQLIFTGIYDRIFLQESKIKIAQIK